MKFCSNCGNEVSEDAAFCKNCGQKIEDTSTEVHGETSESINSAIVQSGKKGVNKKIIIAVVVILVIIGIGVYVLRGGTSKVDMSEYVDITYGGYNTKGTIAATVDDMDIETAILKAQGYDISETTDDIDDMSAGDWGAIINIESDSDVMELEDSFDIDITPEDGLSNGDEVTITVTFDEDAAKECGLKIKNTSFTEEVSGLKDIQQVDPFDELDVTYSGTAPNGNVSCELDSDKEYAYYLSTYSFTTDKSNDLCNGDTVTVSIDENAIETALENGYELTETSKEYTVSGLDEYVSSLDQITDDMLVDMQSQATDVIDSIYANNIDSYTNSGLSYVGAYLLSPKGTSYWSQNVLYLVYSTTVSSVDGAFEPSTVYLPVEMSNILVYADGTYNFDYDNEIEGDSGLEYSTGWWNESVDGYTDGSSMFNDLVTTQKADWAYEVSEGLTSFGE